ncbi:MAG: transporter [Archangium sp.]|nr:transporter [Archangium sp.]
MIRAGAIAAAALVVLSGARAEAAACCVSASAFGLGRLAVWENGAVLFTAAAAPSPGSWNEHGHYIANPTGTSDVELRPALTGLIALKPRWLLAGRMPWVINARSADGRSDVGHGLGDALLTTRVEAIQIGEYAHVPGVAVNLGVTIPFGTSMARTQRLLATDVTGRGAWALGAGVTLEETWRGTWYLQLSLGSTVPLPMAGVLPGHSQRFGPTFDTTVAAGVELRTGLVVSVIARASYETQLHVDEAPVPDSSALDVGVGPAVSWRFHPKWTVQAAVDTGVFVDGLGDNTPARFTATFGVRHAFF